MKYKTLIAAILALTTISCDEIKNTKKEVPPAPQNLEEKTLTKEESEVEKIIRGTKWGNNSYGTDSAESKSKKIGKYGESAREICMTYLRKGELNERKSAAAGLRALTPIKNQNHYEAILGVYKNEKDFWLKSYLGTTLYQAGVNSKENCLIALNDSDNKVKYIGISSSSVFFLKDPEIRAIVKGLLQKPEFKDHYQRDMIEKDIKRIEK